MGRDPDFADYFIRASRFDVETGELQVNTYTLHDRWTPDVAKPPTGEFAVVWKSYGSPKQGDANKRWFDS